MPGDSPRFPSQPTNPVDRHHDAVADALVERPGLLAAIDPQHYMPVVDECHRPVSVVPRMGDRAPRDRKARGLTRRSTHAGDRVQSPYQLVIDLAIETLDRREWPLTEAEIRVARASRFAAQAIARDLIAADREKEVEGNPVIHLNNRARHNAQGYEHGPTYRSLTLRIADLHLPAGPPPRTSDATSLPGRGLPDIGSGDQVWKL